MSCAVAGELLHLAEPFLNKNMHPTVIIRGYASALDDALEIVNKLSFPINLEDTTQVLNVVQTSLQTKFTSRFGTLMAVWPFCCCACRAEPLLLGTGH